MNTNYDASLVYQFLTQTPEGALKKMLVDKSFGDSHFNILMKIVHSCPEDKFCEHFYASSYPKAKFNAKEIGLKEQFWGDCINALNSRGLLSPAQKSAA